MEVIFLLVPTACVFFAAYIASRFANAVQKNTLGNYRELMREWLAARQNRLSWFSGHSHLAAPYLEAEYLELWNIEIGAEEMLYIFYGMHTRISYLEHREEQRCAVGDGDTDMDAGV